MIFQALAEDNIRSILALCDIYTVLSFGRTNKHLRLLTLEKLLWLDLVENLRRKGIVDQSRSETQSQSQEALVALVKRLLTGPTSWTGPIKPKLFSLARFRSARQPPSHAEISKQSILHGMGPADRRYRVRLLGGGKYTLFENTTTWNLQCWNMQQSTLVWSYEKSLPGSWVRVFGAEIVDGGDAVNIVVSEAGPAQRSGMVQIVHLELRTGISTRHLVGPHRLVGNGVMNAKICGNIVCLDWVPLESDEPCRPSNYCTLVDWKNGLHLRLALISPIDVDLIPNHVVIVKSDKLSDTPEISVINMGALSGYWRHTTGRDYSDPELDSVDITSGMEVMRKSIPMATGECRYGGTRILGIFESPIEDGTYRVWVQVHLSASADTVDPSGLTVSARQMICSYSLSLLNPPQDGIILRQRSAHIGDFPRDSCPTISYSGHRIQLDRRLHAHGIYYPGSQTIPLNLHPSKPYARDMSTYTGALAYSVGESVIVTYFK
ncbi:hypothetical protein DFH07DRAFT_797223 [Mycena maculata]|uniref:F-box domain-containing protein n=1 Tax=Mycena maculata TaxID=230809 RepID=A0AAD7NW61_9AGAR|nr:hypothetical protein DFH07DRAFT_797223 [Mycena maculata]